MVHSSSHQVFRFGEFELDPDAAELRRGGRQVRLQPQPMKLLTLVVRRAGTVVSREEIRTELWPEGTFVDFDQAVNFAIKQVRDALGDSAERPVYLQTLPRRGYRFIAPVETPSDVDENLHTRQPGTTTIKLQKALWSNIADLKLAQRRQRRMTAITVGAAVLIVVALVTVLLVLK
ncbi:MAG TPA: transcriptional regulator [Vicinamibacterales bacterium]|nr:transcriptional regulator [Vicinamibacterales bacterium]